MIQVYLCKDIEGLSALEAAKLAVEAIEELMKTPQVPFHVYNYGIPKKDIT